jgi:hypothetical protein
MIEESVFRNVLKTIKEFPDQCLDIIDSFSDNQFKAKENLLEQISEFLEKDSDLVILGCWYGSILIPLLDSKVNKIIAIDLNDNVVRIGKNKFFKNYENVSWSTGDVFTKQINYSNTKFVINTSCEHMLPMKDWPYWSQLKSNAYFAFQSNNMDWIKGHINCVHSLEEFKNQLPKNSKVLIEDEIDDSRGTRYMIIGKIQNG